MKVRTLKSLLRRRGFRCRAGKGSHSIWTHPTQPDLRLVLAGHDGDEAKPYQLTRARKRQTQAIQTSKTLEAAKEEEPHLQGLDTTLRRYPRPKRGNLPQ